MYTFDMQIKDDSYDNNLRFSRDALSQRRGLLDPVFATVMAALFLQHAWLIIADTRADLGQTKRVV
jgi:hypothetical protein